MRGDGIFRLLPSFALFVLLLVSPAYGAPTNINPTQIPLRQRTADVTVESYGGVAETTLKMRYENLNSWRVGMEADFRLSHGSTLTGFAFEMPDGSMRRGAPVNRLQRHLALDDVKEAPGDISLIQERRAAYHQFRLFPIEAGETRAMEISHIGDLLPWGEEGADLCYNLPLSWNVEYPPDRSKIAAERREMKFTFRMTVHGNQETPYALDRNGEKLFFTKSGEAHTFEHTYDSEGPVAFDAVFDREINVVVPGAGRSGSRVQATDSGRYFYTVIDSGQLTSLIRSSDALPPSRIGIAWDSSLSSVLRDHDREYQFLDAYFRRLLPDDGEERELRVSLLRFRNDVETIKEFVIDRSSGWESLRRELASTIYDGATNYRAARSEMSHPVDEWLFFSDGHENYGIISDRKSETPIHAITASYFTYPKRLRQFATVNGGVLVDLILQSPEEAVDFLRKPRARLTGMESADLADLLLSAQTIGEGELIVLSGRLTEQRGSARLTFKSGGGNGATAVLDVPVTQEADSPMAAREWARMKADEIFSNLVEIDTAGIQRIGREFGVMSPVIALIIPRWEAGADAAPEERASGSEAGGEQYPAEQLKREWAELTARVRDPGAAAETEPPRGPFRDVKREFVWLDLQPQELWSVPVNTYGSGASYIENLRSVPHNGAYGVYRANLPLYWTTPAFFLDTSNVLFEYGLPDLGLLVLSNLAEVDPENKWVLRTVAYRLMELGSPQARVIFEKILKLDEDDPQSYRDLALMYARNGDARRALEILDFVAAHTWGEAFGGVQLAAVRDMGMIRMWQGRPSADGDIDPARLDFPPADIRVMLAADRYSANLRLRLTEAGGGAAGDGLISFSRSPDREADELILPKARSGRYVVEVGYDEDYPREMRVPTLALVTLATHVGTRAQSEWIKTVQLTPGKDGMTAVMEFDFDADRAQHAAASENVSEGNHVTGVAGVLTAVVLLAVVIAILRRR